ncbi:hypothetical protein CYLTODRAFT_418195 [Cylindrobasidium torrendii FP15055 ss-10]|uniref:Chromo domain-containing protein n=1 Tax=Cylindrobasidium torrendii FP15055 ss-10 TaxID=1314674 RepID=A0A0D7BNW2_9AGAR|nr:hypothetical protein CYLTODRAFT_418195 [Cylindrobasidium torrendii FP15055 ss-10]
MADFYAVDHIYEAKVVKTGRSRNILSWKYHTSWVGYGEDSDTWEPARSFAGGSEHFIESFWADTDTGGRDHNAIKQFRHLEVIHRLHPPPPSHALPTAEEEEEPTLPPVKTSKRSRSTASKRKRDPQPQVEDEAPSAKRARSKKPAATSASTSRRGRSAKKTPPTPDPLPSASRGASTEVPDSEIERVELAENVTPVMEDGSSEVAVIEEDVASPPPPAVRRLPPSRKSPSKLSFRRGEPRVMLDSELAQAVERSENGNGGAAKTKTVPASAPVPGRASRPMGRRGRVKSKSVGRAQRPPEPESVEVDMDVQMHAQDASPVDALNLADSPTTEQKEKPRISPLAHVSAGFLPSSSTGSSFSLFKNTMPTIWGLVSGFGSSSPSTSKPTDGLFIKAHFQDTQPIHIQIVNVIPEDKASVFSSASSGVRGPDGTFYEEEKAQKLVGALGSGSAAGVVVLPSDASEKQTAKFDAFKSQLAQGGLFVHASPMVAICSSRNGLMTQRLNVPACLTNGNEECLVAVAVSIQDPTLYMDVVMASA